MNDTAPKPSGRPGARFGLSRAALTILLWIVAFLFLLPLAWMFATSLMPESHATSASISPLPNLTTESGEPIPIGSPAYFAALAHQAHENYTGVFDSPMADFRRYMRNSVIVAALSVVGMTLSSAVAAYGLSRIPWRGRDAVFVLVLATMMIPFTVIMAPQYLLFKHLGWIGTFRPLWVPAWFGGAFSIFLLRQFFLGIPRELDEAARIDGCSHLGIFCRVIVPLAKPALTVVALLHVIWSWNEFVQPLIFLNHQDMYTAALGLQMFQSQHGSTPWTIVMAACVIVTAPILVLFFLAQKMLVDGIATQGLKE
ncbi:MAG: carbohydrate ABC transporter permease [Planctomycetota bacterium]|nr:MAG: carbohydrate ABC transporter permease [Planctomycetota bacterium]